MDVFLQNTSGQCFFPPVARAIFVYQARFRPGRERPFLRLARCRRQQALHTQQIECAQRQAEHPFHPTPSAKLGLPHSRHLFDPAKHLLHPLAFLLALFEPGIVPLFRPQSAQPRPGASRHIRPHAVPPANFASAPETPAPDTLCRLPASSAAVRRLSPAASPGPLLVPLSYSTASRTRPLPTRSGSP